VVNVCVVVMWCVCECECVRGARGAGPPPPPPTHTHTHTSQRNHTEAASLALTSFSAHASFDPRVNRRPPPKDVVGVGVAHRHGHNRGGERVACGVDRRSSTFWIARFACGGDFVDVVSHSHHISWCCVVVVIAVRGGEPKAGQRIGRVP
jgi:hypothetical protein